MPDLPIRIPLKQLEPLLLTSQKEQVLHKTAQLINTLTLCALVVGVRTGVLHVIVKVHLCDHLGFALGGEDAAGFLIQVDLLSGDLLIFLTIIPNDAIQIHLFGLDF